jgi:hypothetical protein
MIMDRTGLFSDNQAVTATTTSTNIIDLGATGTPYGSPTAITRDIGAAQVPITVNVTNSFNNLTSLTISIETATDPAFTTPNTVYTTPAYSLANVQAGARYLLPDEFPVGTNQRYVRLRYTVAGTAPTIGTITAGVVLSRQKNSRY